MGFRLSGSPHVETPYVDGNSTGPRRSHRCYRTTWCKSSKHLLTLETIPSYFVRCSQYAVCEERKTFSEKGTVNRLYDEQHGGVWCILGEGKAPFPTVRDLTVSSMKWCYGDDVWSIATVLHLTVHINVDVPKNMMTHLLLLVRFDYLIENSPSMYGEYCDDRYQKSCPVEHTVHIIIFSSL